jgi:hypothetical protein
MFGHCFIPLDCRACHRLSFIVRIAPAYVLTSIFVICLVSFFLVVVSVANRYFFNIYLPFLDDLCLQNSRSVPYSLAIHTVYHVTFFELISPVKVICKGPYRSYVKTLSSCDLSMKALLVVKEYLQLVWPIKSTDGTWNP